jgi:hypothetical protein
MKGGNYKLKEPKLQKVRRYTCLRDEWIRGYTSKPEPSQYWRASTAPQTALGITPNRLLKKSFYTGCSKPHRCKACEIMRNEAYFSYAAKTNAARNPAIAGHMGVFQQPAKQTYFFLRLPRVRWPSARIFNLPAYFTPNCFRNSIKTCLWQVPSSALQLHTSTIRSRFSISSQVY